MERYEPETYYIKAYDYEEDWDFTFRHFLNAITDKMNQLGFTYVKEYPESDDVGVMGFHKYALKIFEHKYASICISSESTSDKIIISIIPFDFDKERFAYRCDRELFDKIGCPNELYKKYYWQIEQTASKEELEDLDKRYEASYDRYIDDVFKPLKESVISVLYKAFPNDIYIPCGAWCSSKLELEDED